MGAGAWNFMKGTYLKIAKDTYSAEKQYAENDPQYFSKAFDQVYNANGAMAFMGSAMEGVGQNLPLILLSLIPGGVTVSIAGISAEIGIGAAASATFGVMAHSGIGVGEAYEKSGTLGGREYVYGLATGTMDTALDMVGGHVGGWLGIGKSAVKVGLADTAGKIVKGGLSEFAEEFIESYAEVGLQRALGIDPNASVTLQEALYAGAVGFASGGMMAGASSVINHKGMQGVGNRVMKAGETDATIRTAKEITSAFKSNGEIEAEAVKVLQENLDLWESTKDKTSSQAKMILGNITFAMNTVSAMA